MDIFNRDRNFILDFFLLQKLEVAPLEPTGAFSSPTSLSGHSVRTVRTLNSHLPAYVSQPDAVQDIANYVNPLNQYVVAPSTASESNFISDLDFSDIQPEELDVYLGSNEIASDELIFTELNPPNVTHPPLKESSCGEASVNFSQPSSSPVAVVKPLNKDTQQHVQIETAGTVSITGTVSINSGNVVKSMKRPFPECKYFEARPQKSAKKSSSTISENRFETAGFKLTEPSGSSEYVPLTTKSVDHNAYQDKPEELVSSDKFDQAESAGQAAGTGEFPYKKAYQKPYKKARLEKLKELVSSDIFDQAKAAGQAAGKIAGHAVGHAAGHAALQAARAGETPCKETCEKAYEKAYLKACRKPYEQAYQKAYRDKLKELVSSDIFDQAKAAGKAAGKAASKAAKRLSDNSARSKGRKKF